MLTGTQEVQEREMASPASGKEQSHAPVHTEGPLSGRQLCRERPAGAGGHKVEHKLQCAIVKKKANSILIRTGVCVATTGEAWT